MIHPWPIHIDHHSRPTTAAAGATGSLDLPVVVRQKLPEVRVVLMYVHAREETVYQRAIARGAQGRMVSRTEASWRSKTVSGCISFVGLFVNLSIYQLI